MKPEVQYVAIAVADGSLAVMQFVVRGGGVEREATDGAINAEIAKAGLSAVSWRRILPDDLPQSRVDRNAWQDSGKTIAVDPVRKAALDQAKTAARASEIAALKAELARP